MGTGLLLFGSMALFLIIGVPIAFALGAAVWTTIVFSPDFLVTTGIIGQRIFGGLESTSIFHSSRKPNDKRWYFKKTG